MNKLLLVWLVLLASGGCTAEDGTVEISNQTSRPQCTAPIRIDANEPFTVEAGDSARFDLPEDDYVLALVGSAPTGCEYVGSFASDNQCVFFVSAVRTTVIRMFDQGAGGIQVIC